jgi:hypothetical protein
MEAIYAGISAWIIELSITCGLLLLLKHEERKVYRRRAAKKEKV